MADTDTQDEVIELPLICIAKDGLEQAGLSGPDLNWARANDFSGQLGRLLTVPGADGARKAVLFGTGTEAERPPLALGLAGAGLAPGRYRLEGDFGEPNLAALGFWLGTYRFTRYKKSAGEVELTLPEGADANQVSRLLEAAFLARDLVNTPANDLGPDAFEERVAAFAKTSNMQMTVTRGDALLEARLPMIHAVGRASSQDPRLVDLTWGPQDAPKLTLVGKGVTFDTGGLDIKSPSGMLLMKKDMGGAANVLALAHAIVTARLNVRLRVLLPIVENAISGSAFRPGDVLPSRKGLSVEIGNTDAEGRLILADALALADEEAPELLVDMATLTGAARVALGPELPPIYSTDPVLAAQLAETGRSVGDPLWPMPLWSPYEKWLDSRIADVSHISSAPFAGSVTAALFLKRFVEKAGTWVHLDIFAWAPEARAGYPVGGADQGVRAFCAYLKRRYGTQKEG